MPPTTHSVMKNSQIVLVVVVLLLVVFFFVPIIYYNPMNKAGNFSGYESLSCALFNVGVSYGHNSFHENSWGFIPSCGFLHFKY